MELRKFPLLTIAWFVLLVGSNAEEQDLEQERRPIKTFTTIYGEIIDCIDMYKQPAFDHPLLKDHKLQRKPSFPLKAEKHIRRAQVKKNQLERSHVLDGCPEGTIPILRKTKVDRTRANLAEQTPAQIYHPLSPQSPGFHFAFLEMDGTSKPFRGAKAFIDNYIPKCTKEQLSGAQIWIISDFTGPTNMIQVGWRVQPDLYDDDRSHFITYWRGENGSGCYDLQCPGFVQVDPSFILGQVLPNSSTYGGPQVEIHLAVRQDMNTKNWWLVVEQDNFDVNVGYWPAKLLPKLSAGARRLQLGGVTHTANGLPFPPMGSGIFPDNSYSHACYFRQIHYLDRWQNWIAPKLWDGLAHTSSKACYGATRDVDDGFMGYTLLFGGPGGDGCGA